VAARSSTSRAQALGVCAPAARASVAYSAWVSLVLRHFVRELDIGVYLPRLASPEIE